MSKYQIRQITIRTYKEQVLDVGPAGIIATGCNGSGKSSLLDAIEAAAKMAAEMKGASNANR